MYIYIERERERERYTHAESQSGGRRAPVRGDLVEPRPEERARGLRGTPCGGYCYDDDDYYYYYYDDDY